MNMKNIVLVLTIMVISLAMVSAVQAANHNLTLPATTPGAITVSTTFEDIPVLLLNVTQYNGSPNTPDNVTAVKLKMNFGANNVNGAKNFSLAFYNDTNANGIVDANETLLLAYTNHDQATGVEKSYNIFDVTIAENSSVYILVVAKTENVVAAGDIFNVSSGNITLALTIAQNQTIEGNIISSSGTAPSITLANGAANPPAYPMNSTNANYLVHHINITNAAATADTLSKLNITPHGDLEENADVSRVWFYKDQDADGLYSTSDIVLESSPTKFSADDNTMTEFTINGSLLIPASSSVGLFVIYEFDGSASIAETHFQNITSVALGSTSTATGIVNSNNITIDNLGVWLTTLQLIDSDSNGLIDQVNITFNDTVYITTGDWQVCTDLIKMMNITAVGTGSIANNLTTFVLASDISVNITGSNYLIFNVTNAKNNGLYDTGTLAYAYALNPNGSCGNITDLAGNGIQYADYSDENADTMSPVLMNVTTADLNDNGYLDCYNLTFSEAITENSLVNYPAADGGDVSLNASNVSITGRSGLLTANFSKDAARNDTLITVCFAEASSYDTSSTAPITLTVGAMADVAGNGIVAVAATTAVDKARPIPLAGNTIDNDLDGKIDGIKLTFSENVYDLSYNKSNITISGGRTLVADALKTVSGDSVNNTIVYLNITEADYDTGVVLNISVNTTRWIQDLVENEAPNVTQGLTFNITDGAAPAIINQAFGDAPSAQTGWTRSLTGSITINLSEAVNCTYTNGTLRVAGSVATSFDACINTHTNGTDTGNVITTINITPATLTDGTNHSIIIDTKDNTGNALNTTNYLWADVTVPYIDYAWFNDSDFAYNGVNVAAADLLYVMFSEEMREAGTADAGIFFLQNVSQNDQLAGSGGDEVVVDSVLRRQVVITLGAADDLIVRGIWNTTSSATGINVTNEATTNTLTDLAGNFINQTSLANEPRDILDNWINITANTWTVISVPYGINATPITTATTGKTASLYTYNSTWTSVAAAAMIPYQSYLIKVNESVILKIQSVARNTGTGSGTTGVIVYEGWNMLGVDGYLDNTGTDVTAAGEWLRSLGQGVNSGVATVIDYEDLGTPLDPQALSAGDIDPFKSYWVSVGDLSGGLATFTGYGRW